MSHEEYLQQKPNQPETHEEEEEAQADMKSELEAIVELDFEKAFSLAHKRFQYFDDEAENEKAHYEEQAQILEQQNYDQYNDEINRISQDYLQNADHYKNMWQDYCKALVVQHRSEAAEMERQWREARDIQIARANEKAQASYGTARILAMCDMYDKAIELRNNAQEAAADINSPELQKIDIEYTDRFQHMTKRHFAEYQYLHRHLKALMRTLRERANAQRKTAEANLQVEQAQNTTLILETVVKEGVSPKAKESLIQSFSPRSKERPASKARSYALRLSPRSFSSRAASSLAYSSMSGITPRAKK
ncbi:hypothetical protein TRFO_05887 [Tritrichomonas foetus]|uniref:Uncharacterized protein n=1 Tax=Tritrichomonas foetus TaxID=1144522 RepID=A0A1J4K2Q8_9EUKA|nr:hypothetical protein TRFO_05887 [Tritrichomonas foetus]|eukprot:OHT05721.1 hypothetical protein TRFO_05887 [Tritrichomonas foetus]